VLDVAPTLPASKARPDGVTERMVAEHGWIDADDLTAYTGERLEPTLGRWVVSPDALATTRQSVHDRVLGAGELGLDVAALDERERAVLATLDDVAVVQGRARQAEARDPLADHPFVAALQQAGVTPPDATGVDKMQLRELVRRKLVIEREGLYFHPDAIDTAARTASVLLGEHPAGFTVSQFREALGVTRKHAVPLAAELDSRGITRRRDDVRIAGPRAVFVT
jgi:selenocysteine-specific elongation factor